MFFAAAAYSGPITAPAIPPVSTKPIHFGLDLAGTRLRTANLKLCPAAEGSANSTEETHRATKLFSEHASDAVTLATIPTHDVTRYVFNRPPSFVNRVGKAMLHPERATSKIARGTVFHDDEGENAELARFVAVIEAVTTENESAQPALSAVTAGQSCRCASSGTTAGGVAIPATTRVVGQKAKHGRTRTRGDE
tara:strand:- start:2117 stop:2698 length:582 start_codon:yes stop_codon:yes gene_type:complete